MGRPTARGRVFPQGYSTDRRYGRLSLKSCALFPLMWSNADDQGRLCGDPEEIKYAVCPNVDHITKADIPEILKDLAKNDLIKVYNTSQTDAIQLLDWWHPILGQRPQWAYPSQYPPPEGWKDRLRYHPTPTEIITENWVPPGQFDRALPSALPSPNKKGLRRKLGKKLGSKAPELPQTPSLETGNESGKLEKGEGEGNIPSALGSPTPTPSPATLSPEEMRIFELLKKNFRMRWGKPLPPEYTKIKPRAPNAREIAQLRDLAREISAAGGCGLTWIKEAFDEAAGQHKKHISYVRAVLLAWMDVPRNRSP